MKTVTATTKKKTDNTVYRITEVFSNTESITEIMKRLMLKKAREFRK